MRFAYNWEEAKYRLIKNYLILLVIALASFGALNIWITGDISALYFFAIIICFFILLILKGYYRIKPVQYIAILACILLIYYFGLDRSQSHAHLFYIDILLSIVLIFDFKTDIYKIGSLAGLILLLFCLNVFTDFLYVTPFLQPSQYHSLFLLTLFYFFLILVLNLVYILKINHITRWHEEQNSMVPEEVTAAMDLKDEVRIEELNHLKAELYEDHKGFLNHFELLFPRFSQKMKHLRLFSVSEMELLAMLKMNYSTGEIAQITNSSLKAIESKKYRLKKKIKLQNNASLYAWVHEL